MNPMMKFLILETKVYITGGATVLSVISIEIILENHAIVKHLHI